MTGDLYYFSLIRSDIGACYYVLFISLFFSLITDYLRIYFPETTGDFFIKIIKLIECVSYAVLIYLMIDTYIYLIDKVSFFTNHSVTIDQGSEDEATRVSDGFFQVIIAINTAFFSFGMKGVVKNKKDNKTLSSINVYSVVFSFGSLVLFISCMYFNVSTEPYVSKNLGGLFDSIFSIYFWWWVLLSIAIAIRFTVNTEVLDE